MQMSETFERSCAHWSEARRDEMEAFYALATADYRVLAEAMDWRGWLAGRQRDVGDRPLRLLDVACGSGKFPLALAAHAGVSAAELQPIAYSLLDPSAFSISEARAALPEPFRADAEYEVPLQELVCARGAFDIAWATHALYAIPPADLPLATERFLHALGDSGVGLIAHSTAEGHYIRFHRAFLEAFGGDPGQLYSSAEQIRTALEAHGAGVELRELAYENGVADSARDDLEGFLQRCAFDDRFSLADMLATEPLASYLAPCRNDGQWRFPQRVALMVVTP
jgi:SAM-dependent methyltransferase